jgi:chemotaxis protein MotB
MNPDLDMDEGGFEEPTAPGWMATFGDMMSLLLTFFVLLMSFASMDVRRFAAVVGSMRDAFGVQRQHPGLVEGLSTSLVNLSETESSPFLEVLPMPVRVPEREQALLERLEMSVAEQGLERLVNVEDTERGIVVRMPGQLLFAPGSAELRPESLVFLREIADLVRSMPHPVAIEGHTDSTPAAPGRFESNWNLSAARAVAALRFLVEVGGIESSRLRATGFADTRPLASNDDPEGRAQNRRVEIVFLRNPHEMAGSALAEAAQMPADAEAAAPSAGEAAEPGGLSE